MIQFRKILRMSKVGLGLVALSAFGSVAREIEPNIEFSELVRDDTITGMVKNLYVKGIGTAPENYKIKYLIYDTKIYMTDDQAAVAKCEKAVLKRPQGSRKDGAGFKADTDSYRMNYEVTQERLFEIVQNVPSASSFKSSLSDAIQQVALRPYRPHVPVTVAQAAEEIQQSKKSRANSKRVYNGQNESDGERLRIEAVISIPAASGFYSREYCEKSLNDKIRKLNVKKINGSLKI